ncbi:MAG: hydrogenase 3 maturation endopeptidase HyCI [Candidatus Jordarchaeales archaeon]
MLAGKLRELLKGARRVAVIGVGSRFRGDDALGLEVARRLKGAGLRGVLVVEAETVPENFTGELRRFHPSHVLLVDAAHFGGKPGDVVVASGSSSMRGVSFSTHHMPLSMFARFVEASIGSTVVLVGVQPGSLHGEGLSPEVEDAVSILTKILSEVLSELPGLEAVSEIGEN